MYEFRPLTIAISSSSQYDCTDKEGRLSKRRIRVVWLNPFTLQRQRSKKCYNWPPSPRRLFFFSYSRLPRGIPRSHSHKINELLEFPRNHCRNGRKERGLKQQFPRSYSTAIHAVIREALLPQNAVFTAFCRTSKHCTGAPVDRINPFSAVPTTIYRRELGLLLCELRGLPTAVCEARSSANAEWLPKCSTVLNFRRMEFTLIWFADQSETLRCYSEHHLWRLCRTVDHP